MFLKCLVEEDGIFVPGLVVPNKRPVQYCDRASKHSLHRALGHALSQCGPEDCHWFGPTHVTIYDGWLHTP